MNGDMVKINTSVVPYSQDDRLDEKPDVVVLDPDEKANR
jgi:hypothetical protein